MFRNNENPAVEKRTMQENYWTLCLIIIGLMVLAAFVSQHGFLIPWIALGGSLFTLCTAPVIWRLLRNRPADLVGKILLEERNRFIIGLMYFCVTVDVVLTALLILTPIALCLLWIIPVTVVLTALLVIVVVGLIQIDPVKRKDD